MSEAVGNTGDRGIEVRSLHRPDDMEPIAALFQQIWGSPTPLVGVELLCAVAHSGGYVAAAMESGRVVGGSFGFLAAHRGARALHSHVTGVLPGLQHAGVGRTMKFHQRDWARANGLDWITWTYDPLVRRNAWFNIAVLGASIDAYLINFYGPMEDALNANDETDRLVVAWSTTAPIPTAHPRSELSIGQPFPGQPASDCRYVEIPDDIVELRRANPEAALQWRYRVRTELATLLEQGAEVVGFTRSGSYVLRMP
jgi:predicted GNAT superfamily acetyltransferase